MATKPKAILSTHDGREASPITKASNVLFENGQTAQDILNDRQDAMISPVIENSSSMFKVGQGDNVDYSANVVNGAYESMVLKGKTMVNCIQEPSSKDVVLPYEFEDGQYVTINDTKESGALGVELKGQTLVNIHKSATYSLSRKNEGWYENLVAETNRISFEVTDTSTDGWRYLNLGELNLDMLKPNTKYLVYFGVANFPHNLGVRFMNGDATGKISNEAMVSQGGNWAILTTSSEIIKSEQVLYVSFTNVLGKVEVGNAMIFEYQEGMENWDIPYIEGMTSCKMPILCTVGKNLFDINKCKPSKTINDDGNEVTSSTPNHYAYGEFIPINNEFTMSITSDNGSVPNNANGTRLRFYDENKNLVDSQWFAQSFKESNGRKYCTISMNGAKYLKINFSATGGKTDTTYEAMQTIQIEEGSAQTSYEPHKSSILSLPEEVVLRGIPNGVHDTLNLRTGEYTQRVGVLNLNGSEYWNIGYGGATGDVNKFEIAIPCENMLGYAYPSICDKFVWYPASGTTPEWGYRVSYSNTNKNTYFMFAPPTSVVALHDREAWKTWLSQNPTTVYYQLETPVVTKINLPSTLKSWNTITHIYSEIPENTLYPTLSHSNPSYPVILKPSTKYSIVANSYSNDHTNSAINFNLGGATASTTVGNRVTTVTTPSTLSNELLTMSGRGNKLNNVMVIEGDVVGDEVYFEGICDCKSPILLNVGKNLFDWEAHHWRLNRFQWSHGDGGLGNGNALGRAGVEWVSIKTLKLKPSQTYYTNGYISFYENDGKGLCIDRCNHTGIFTVPTNAEIACVSAIINDGVKLEYMFDPKIIISEIEMEYEPYKSNILSANGDKIELTEDMFEEGGIGGYSQYLGKTYEELKSLFPSSLSGKRLMTVDLVKVKPNTSYNINSSDNFAYFACSFNANKIANGGTDTGYVKSTIFTTSSDTHYIAIIVKRDNDGSINMLDFKNNNFTLSEVDKTIVLRSLPSGVCDTLNVETGEYVQRIGEKVFDGSDNGWQVLTYPPHDNDTHYQFKYWFGENLIGGDLWLNAQSIIANTLPSASEALHWGSQGKYGIGGDRSHFMITWEKSSSPFHDVTTLNAWLQSNPVTVQYELATPIVSTIDVQGFPYAYKDGHIQLTSGSIAQSLTPKVEYSLPTNRNGQIRSNQKMVEKHQKELDRLQAIILANLINSQYQQTLTTLKYELSRV